MKKLIIVLMMGLVALTTGCESEPETLKEAYEDYFDIGVALSKTSYNYYDEEFYDEFSTVTCENEMKWENIQSSEGTFYFNSADIIADYVRETGKSLRGHTLVWHSQTPTWVGSTDDSLTVDENIEILLARVESYYKTLQDRYGDILIHWDVANEVLSDSSNPSEIYRTDSLYYQACGSDDEKFEYFISEVFKMVKEYSPDVVRYYNDYNIITNTTKRTKLITFITNINALGADVQGIGCQGHIDYSITYDTVDTALTHIETLGLQEIAITELEISIYTSDSDTEVDVLSDEQQTQLADAYDNVFSALRDHKDTVANVTFWGISDASTWKDNYPVYGRNDHPLLFDDFGEKKEAYYRVLNF